MRKDRLVTPSYCFILAANLSILWILLLTPYFLFIYLKYFIVQHYDRYRTVLLHHFIVVYPAFFRLSARCFCTKTSLPAGLFHIHTDIRRLYGGRYADDVYHLPHHTWYFVRNGYRGREYHCNRHHAVFTTRRRAYGVYTDWQTT